MTCNATAQAKDKLQALRDEEDQEISNALQYVQVVIDNSGSLPISNPPIYYHYEIKINNLIDQTNALRAQIASPVAMKPAL